MTRKDFELIARVLRTAVDPHASEEFQDVQRWTQTGLTRRFQDELAKTNERFDAARFFEAATGRKP